MRKLSVIYRTLNILSVDVALGAVCGALFISHLIGKSASIISLFLLGMAVWAIYTTDHLIDAFRLQCPAINERHSFHQRHFLKLSALLMLAVVLVLPLLMFLEWEVFFAGLVMLILVGFYLFILNRIRGLKEFLVAVLYCIGISIPANSYATYSWNDFLIVLQFFIVCLMNLCVFAFFETNEDKEHRFPSLALVLGKRLTIRILLALLLLDISISFFVDNLYYSLILVFMGCCHAAMLGYESDLRKAAKYRLLGDALFFVPIFAVWIPGN